ncbi:MAG: hypothetical protein ACRDRT_13365 [Pseudonocardiaceae bacterium]
MMDTPDGAVTPIRIEDATSYSPTKGTHRVRNVHYRLPDGTTSYITVPLDEYNAETVHSALAEAAQVHAEVMAVRAVPQPPQRIDTSPSRYG